MRLQARYGPFTRRMHMLRGRGENLTPLLNECGEIMLSSVEENFLQEGRFSTAADWHGGTQRWPDLAESTKHQRRKEGKWPGKILQKSQGGLAASIAYNVNGNNLEIGSNKAYAAIQQFGGMAGRGKKVKIPGRPYLVIQEEDIDDMMDAAGRHLWK